MPEPTKMRQLMEGAVFVSQEQPLGLEPAHSIAEVQPIVNELISLMILFLRAGLEQGQGR